MKVLHIISGGDTGGAKTHVSFLLSALSEEIYVTVVCVVDGAFYKEIKKTDVLSVLYEQKNRYDMGVLIKIKALIKEKRFDIIHAHGARANVIALCLKPFVRIPVVTTMHSDYKMDFTKGLYKRYLFTWLNAFSLKFLDYYIAVSDSFADMLIRRGFNRNDVYTVYNAVDFDRPPSFVSKESFLQRYGIDAEGKTIIGIAARHDRVKGVDVFIRAAAKVYKQRKNAVFLLAGEGGDTDGLKRLAHETGLADAAYFLGFVDDIGSFFNCIDINVLSSHSESFTYVLLEGAMYKKATVSTAVGGIPMLIKDGETGLLARAGDHMGLAEKIIELMDSEQLRSTYGEALYAYAKANYSKDSMKNSHIDIYRDIIRRRKAAGKYFDCMLSGYYGFKNSGDDALLTAITGSLKDEKPDISIVALSKDPKETAKRHGIYAVNRFNVIKIRRYMARTKLFITGGGSHIADNSSTRSLIYYSTLVRWAKTAGLKCMYYANGVGPITKKQNVPRAKRALDAADYITLRDAESLAALKRLGADATQHCLITCDPVLTVKSADDMRAAEILLSEKIPLNEPFFIVSARAWKSNDADFIAKITSAIRSAYTKYSITPVFIAMQPQDARIIKKIMRALDMPSYMLSRTYGADELIAVISRAEFVLSMRLHALIYAAVAGVPPIGIVYDPKVLSFMNAIGPEDYVEAQAFDADRLFAIIGRVMDHRGVSSLNTREKVIKLTENAGRDAKIAVELLTQ